MKGNRYGLPERMDLRVGPASVTRNGDAFVRAEGGGADVFVPGVNLGSAMDGDRVVVRIEGHPPGRSPVGRVIKVLERARTAVVGTLHRGPPLPLRGPARPAHDQGHPRSRTETRATRPTATW